MLKSDREEISERVKRDVKRPYVAPRLLVYGNIGELTKGSNSGGGNDGNFFPPNQKGGS
jgi:hypothetical protein